VEDLTDLLSNISEGYTTNVEFNKYVKTQKKIITTIEVAKNTNKIYKTEARNATLL